MCSYEITNVLLNYGYFIPKNIRTILEIKIVFPSGISSSLKNIFISGSAIYKKYNLKNIITFFYHLQKIRFICDKIARKLKMQLLLNFERPRFSHNLKK